MFWLFLKVKWFLFREENQIRRDFPSFARFEHAFKRAYRFQNPFHLCRNFLKQRGEKEPDAYGETPIPIFARIAKECCLHPDDLLFEVGCGRGRGAIFLSHLCGCQVIGIDWVPAFIRTANDIAAKVDPSLKAFFRCADMHSVDYSDATLIYLYGTCLSDAQVLSMIGQFEKTRTGTKIITVSFPLTDYSSRFRVVNQFTGRFPWGEGEVFVQIKN